MAHDVEITAPIESVTVAVALPQVTVSAPIEDVTVSAVIEQVTVSANVSPVTVAVELVGPPGVGLREVFSTATPPVIVYPALNLLPVTVDGQSAYRLQGNV